MINASSKAGNPADAEAWLRKMVAAGLDANVRSYTAVIEGWAKMGNATKANEAFKEMLGHGIQPTVVTFTSLSKPLAKRGDWKKVEGLLDQLRSCGLEPNEYFLCGMLNAYANAQPQQCQRAETTFRETYAAGHIRPDEFVLGSLGRAVGHDRCKELCAELGLNNVFSRKKHFGQAQGSVRPRGPTFARPKVLNRAQPTL
jgi:pentatricopeptide repeat protein